MKRIHKRYRQKMIDILLMLVRKLKTFCLGHVRFFRYLEEWIKYLEWKHRVDFFWISLSSSWFNMNEDDDIPF